MDGYDNWRAPLLGDTFDPAVDRFLKPAARSLSNRRRGSAMRPDTIPKSAASGASRKTSVWPKPFPITESIKLDFRAEAFNLLQPHGFRDRKHQPELSDIGQVTNQVNDPRTMQAALKIYW